MMSKFSDHATRLVERGYSVIPIIPGQKRPGEFKSNNWTGMNGWQKFCDVVPTKSDLEAWAQWADASLCVALGRASNLTAIDFDYGSPEVRAALEACLPPSPVRKMGAKGYTSFYRGYPSTSKKYLIDGVSVIEVLAHGKQTVLPPSLHPEGMEYRWLTLDTLEDMAVDELPEIPSDIHERIIKALAPFQTKAVPLTVKGSNVSASSQSAGGNVSRSGDDTSYWRDINDKAMASLEAWVPKLFPDATRAHAGSFRAVAHWRGGENNNVSIHPDGIKDWVTDEPMTPLDLVMRANSCDLEMAVQWLKSSLGMQTDIVFVEEDFTQPVVAEKPKKVSKKDKNHIPMPDDNTALGMLVNHINRTSLKPQPELAIAAALCAIGVLAGRKYRSPSNIRTNIMTIGIADSGAGKNHARVIINRLITDTLGAGAYIGGNKIGSGPGLLTAVHRHPAMLFQLDEFGMFLHAVANRTSGNHYLTQILDNLTELFTTSNDVFRGTEYADQRNRPRFDIVQPNVCLYGTTTPQVFWRALQSGNAVDGSLARFLVFESKDSYPDSQELIEIPPPEELVSLLARIMEPIGATGNVGASLDIGGLPPPGNLVTATYDDESAKLFDALDKEVTKTLRDHAGTKVTSFYAREVEMTIKVAMIHALGRDPENPIITARDFNFARSIVTHSIQSMIDGIERFVADNTAESNSKKVMELIRQAGFISRTELCKRTQFLGRDRDTVIKHLEDAELIEKVLQKTGGRSRQMYRVKV